MAFSGQCGSAVNEEAGLLLPSATPSNSVALRRATFRDAREILHSCKRTGRLCNAQALTRATFVAVAHATKAAMRRSRIIELWKDAVREGAAQRSCCAPLPDWMQEILYRPSPRPSPKERKALSFVSANVEATKLSNEAIAQAVEPETVTVLEHDKTICCDDREHEIIMQRRPRSKPSPAVNKLCNGLETSLQRLDRISGSHLEDINELRKSAELNTCMLEKLMKWVNRSRVAADPSPSTLTASEVATTKDTDKFNLQDFVNIMSKLDQTLEDAYDAGGNSEGDIGSEDEGASTGRGNLSDLRSTLEDGAEECGAENRTSLIAFGALEIQEGEAPGIPPPEECSIGEFGLLERGSFSSCPDIPVTRGTPMDVEIMSQQESSANSSVGDMETLEEEEDLKMSQCPSTVSTAAGNLGFFGDDVPSIRATFESGSVDDFKDEAELLEILPSHPENVSSVPPRDPDRTQIEAELRRSKEEEHSSDSKDDDTERNSQDVASPRGVAQIETQLRSQKEEEDLNNSKGDNTQRHSQDSSSASAVGRLLTDPQQPRLARRYLRRYVDARLTQSFGADGHHRSECSNPCVQTTMCQHRSTGSSATAECMPASNEVECTTEIVNAESAHSSPAPAPVAPPLLAPLRKPLRSPNNSRMTIEAVCEARRRHAAGEDPAISPQMPYYRHDSSSVSPRPRGRDHEQMVQTALTRLSQSPRRLQRFHERRATDGECTVRQRPACNGYVQVVTSQEGSTCEHATTSLLRHRRHMGSLQCETSSVQLQCETSSLQQRHCRSMSTTVARKRPSEDSSPGTAELVGKASARSAGAGHSCALPVLQSVASPLSASPQLPMKPSSGSPPCGYRRRRGTTLL